MNKVCQKIEKVKEMEGIKAVVETFGSTMALIFEEEILEKRNPSLSLEFARTVKGADVIRHGDIVIESENPEINYDYAIDIDGSNKKKHGEVIVRSKHPGLNFLYACYADIENIEPYIQVLIENQRYDLVEEIGRERSKVKRR